MSYLEGDFIKVKSNHYEKLFKFIIEIQKLNKMITLIVILLKMHLKQNLT